MKKAVMMSIHQKWVEKIASGEKTVEVRKTVPKCGTPFKVYMYCTESGTPLFNNSGKVTTDGLFYAGIDKFMYRMNGMVVGEFVCDYVDEFESEFVDDDCYESVALVEYDEDDGDRNTIIMVDNEDEHFENRYPFKEACLSWEELKKYIGIGIKTFYGWHVSDLKIYDKPKALREFRHPCVRPTRAYNCIGCKYQEQLSPIIYGCNPYVRRPPQSWCYVEEL